MDLVDSCDVTGYLITSEVCPPILWKSRGSKLFDHEFQKIDAKPLLFALFGAFAHGNRVIYPRGVCRECARL